MFLEAWMLGILAMVFGICAFVNYKHGVQNGIEMCLFILHKKKIIDLADVIKITNDLKC